MLRDCPGCEGNRTIRRHALMAPFIASYVLDRPPFVCVLCACQDCGLTYFGRPYSDAEIARLYDGYRGEAYVAARHGFEPWYTRKFNDDIGGEAGTAARRELYQGTLAQLPEASAVETVLDYAGDRGQIMRGGPGREHTVFEISGATPEPGVIGISNPTKLEGRNFDLVLLCSVVEHFSRPLEQVREVARFVRPGGLLYVEVPDDALDIERIPSGDWYVRYLEFLARRPFLRLPVDFWSTGFRIKFGAIPPLGFVKQHEHLNFFTAGALSRLVERAGLQTLVCTKGAGSVVALCRLPCAHRGPQALRDEDGVA